jgi:hypothetical protein
MKTPLEERQIVEAIAATRGVPTNLRPAGPMLDKRTKRRRTRAAIKKAALSDSE